VILLDDCHKAEVLATIKTLMKAVKLRLYIITDVEDAWVEENAERVVRVPKSGFLTALLCVYPLQLLAYELTLKLKMDPDRPRNLSKELTTI